MIGELKTAVDFRGKKILIMGLGLHGGGVGAARFFAGRGASLTITDLRTEKELQGSLAQLKNIRGISYVLGRHRKSDFLHADLIVKNPGVPPNSPYLLLGRKNHVPITTDVGIFLRQCPAPVIGVTGTRGKSTTCYLIARMLETFFKKNKAHHGRNIFLGGNIRTSVLGFIDEVKPRDIVVLELSSFQLDDIARDSWNVPNARKSPSIAVITNIMRDHLNWHGTMRSYIKAKTVIFAHQKKTDMLFANGSDKIIRKIAAAAPSQVIFPHLPENIQPIVDNNLGAHYRSSVALAIGVCRHLDVPIAIIRSILKNFHGLPGRQELIATIQGVRYINDTTATIPEASVAAITRFRALAKKARLILIAGGSDKKLAFSEMAGAIAQDTDHLILLPGTATERLRAELAKRKKSTGRISVQEAGSMKQAVSMARTLGAKGDYVLLSPGAASFGLFANEFDRGDQFVKAVKDMQN